MMETTDALELLTEQHAEVDELFAQIEDADSADEKTDLFRSLADKLAAHATIEEKIFYPSVLSDKTCAELLEFTEEHLAAKRILADLLALDPDDEHWNAKLTVLKEQIRHHAHQEEEGKLFPVLERTLSADQRAGLGNEMLAMYEELIDREPRMQIPSETTEAAHLEAYY
jgi:hypothetical protein